MNVNALLEKCRKLGAIFTPINNRLRIEAPHPLPEELISKLKEAKADILTQLFKEQGKSSQCWLLEEWRRISIPEWRQILEESIQNNNTSREEYARWMLKEILEDQDFEGKSK